jgi:hypothetical protein
VVSPPAAPPRHDLLYGYFGISGNQIAETADHVNFIHTPDWGDWTTPQSRAAITNRTISQLQEANARGIKQAVVGIGYLVFDGGFTYRGIEELRGLKEQLDALGLSQMVIGIYPVDEPDLHGLSSDTLCALVQDGRSIFPDAKWWVIYSDHGTPGIACYDYVGTDNYGRAAGVLNLLPALSQSQRWILVPGGTDPFRNEIGPFRDRAYSDARVGAIMPFVWFDNFANEPHQGIRSNGLTTEYQQTGREIGK